VTFVEGMKNWYISILSVMQLVYTRWKVIVILLLQFKHRVRRKE